MRLKKDLDRVRLDILILFHNGRNQKSGLGWEFHVLGGGGGGKPF